MQGDHRGVLLLATEPAAGLGLDHPCLPVVDPEGGSYSKPDYELAQKRTLEFFAKHLG